MFIKPWLIETNRRATQYKSKRSEEKKTRISIENWIVISNVAWSLVRYVRIAQDSTEANDVWRVTRKN